MITRFIGVADEKHFVLHDAQTIQITFEAALFYLRRNATPVRHALCKSVAFFTCTRSGLYKAKPPDAVRLHQAVFILFKTNNLRYISTTHSCLAS